MKIKDNSNYLWYTRNNHGIKGPFTLGMVQRFILIGRLKIDDEISQDKRSWETVKNVQVVIPEEMRQLNSSDAQERLLQAQLREDERSKDRRRQKLDAFQGRRAKKDRRQPEDVTIRAHREIRNHAQEKTVSTGRNLLPAVFSFGLIVGLFVLGLYVYYEGETMPVRLSDCNAKPGPGVNWNHCQLEGVQLAGLNLLGAKLNNTNLSGANLVRVQLGKADLAYANLSIASLVETNLKNSIVKGTNFRGADLRNVNFAGADLSHADLSGANITGADFSNAILYRAIWVDGRQCSPDSIGNCRL